MNVSKIIDVAVPGDTRIVKKKKKIEKYRDLGIKIGRIWKTEHTLSPYSLEHFALCQRTKENIWQSCNVI